MPAIVLAGALVTAEALFLCKPSRQVKEPSRDDRRVGLVRLDLLLAVLDGIGIPPCPEEAGILYAAELHAHSSRSSSTTTSFDLPRGLPGLPWAKKTTVAASPRSFPSPALSAPATGLRSSNSLNTGEFGMATTG